MGFKNQQQTQKDENGFNIQTQSNLSRHLKIDWNISENIYKSPESQNLLSTKDGHVVAQAKCPIPKKQNQSNIYHYITKIASGNPEGYFYGMIIGFAVKLKDFDRKCYYTTENAFGMDLISGYIWSYKKDKHYSNTKIKVGDEIGSYVNLDEGSIWFTINSERQGTAFLNQELLGLEIYPTVQMLYAGQSIEAIPPNTEVPQKMSKNRLIDFSRRCLERNLYLEQKLEEFEKIKFQLENQNQTLIMENERQAEFLQKIGFMMDDYKSGEDEQEQEEQNFNNGSPSVTEKSQNQLDKFTDTILEPPNKLGISQNFDLMKSISILSTSPAKHRFSGDSKDEYYGSVLKPYNMADIMDNPQQNAYLKQEKEMQELIQQNINLIEESMNGNSIQGSMVSTQKITNHDKLKFQIEKCLQNMDLEQENRKEAEQSSHLDILIEEVSDVDIRENTPFFNKEEINFDGNPLQLQSLPESAVFEMKGQ